MLNNIVGNIEQSMLFSTALKGCTIFLLCISRVSGCSFFLPVQISSILPTNIFAFHRLQNILCAVSADNRCPHDRKIIKQK